MGPQERLFGEKTQLQKSHATVPLRAVTDLQLFGSKLPGEAHMGRGTFL